MRKAILGAMVAGLILGAAASEAAAQEWDIGVGWMYSSNFGGGYKSPAVDNTNNSSYTLEAATPYSGYGAHVFFATTYAEASVGFLFAKYLWKPKETRGTVETGGVTTTTGKQETVSTINLNLGLWLKYPYNLITNVFTLFPIMGVDYELCGSITSTSKGAAAYAPSDANNLSRTWFKAGAGFDINLSERIYLHSVGLYGIGWKNSTERNLVKSYGGAADTKLSHGPTGRLGVGYRFDFD